MNLIWDWIKKGYLRIIGPIGDWLVRHRIHPNTITTLGTFCTIVGGVIYATGHIRTAGWWLGLTAFFDVLDGTVARRTGRSSTFGAFYDSALDRVADGAVLGGLIIFYGSSPRYGSTIMQVVTLVGLVGAYMTSYTRARAEALGIDAKVGVLQRPERVTLLSAPQAFFGLALDGWILAAIIVLLTVSAWITVVQRFIAVHAASRPTIEPRETMPSGNGAPAADSASPPQALVRPVSS
ncbi:MAG: CDP-alcohol phosphatidyltransferase family protein [Gemmatimonadaceae bacterium]|nr:CDP-alcohol phosphatidyltransferase family protein [Gemmatimonadaceae bacterium]